MTAGRVAEPVVGMMIGPARQDLVFDCPGLADVRTATDQPAGQSLGHAHNPGPAGKLDELPSADRTVNNSMILSISAFIHTPPVAQIVAESEIIVKKIF
jgi:hypothetical protein